MKWKKRLIHGGVLAAVFILAVGIFGYMTNKKNDNMTADMGAATRPQVNFSYNGYAVNDLPAYKNEMDITATRDTVTPVANGQLEMHIKAYEQEIASAAYTVYTLDGQEKLMENDVNSPGETVTLALDNEGLLSEERVMEIVLNLGEDKQMHYYTRIVDANGLNLLDCLDYVRSFHENALVKAEGVGIGTAIEPNEQGDNTTLHHVTIHSDYDHVTWGRLEPKVEGSESWNIKELNSTYTSVELQYRVRCKGEENEEDTYQVKEFFRVRHIPSYSKTFLLDYDRTMDQIFDATKVMLSEKGIILGIADRNLPYMVNEDGTVVSFVQADELWNYNRDKDKLSLVFSFADAENTDTRNLFRQHEVRLLDMDGAGNTTFAVYGYMNRGEHEGEVGVAVYYYNIEQNSVEEKAFISSDKSYERAVSEMGGLTYYNVSTDYLYVLVDGTLFEINMAKGKKTELAAGLKEQQYAVSDDGHIIAYQTGEEAAQATQIILKDFATDDERTIECAANECIQPLGFVNSDFVYGVAKTADTGKTVSGQEVIPLYKVEIVNEKNKVIKTYEQSGVFVLDTTFDDNMITLQRAVREGGTYTGINEDYITSNEELEESNIYVDTYATELKETQVRIIYADGISDKEPKLLKPKQVLIEDAAVVTFDNTDATEKYYVYGLGSLLGVYDRAGEAIRAANECNGVVVDSKQRYVWERGNRNLKYTISNQDELIESIRTQLSSGKSPVEVMDVVTDVGSRDLAGCTVEQLLYVIGQGRPVVGIIDAQTSVILIGYGESTVTYVDVASGERVTVSQEEMDNMTQGSGHAYVG